MESEGGSCPMNGGEPHQFRYCKCRLCGKAEAADLLKDDGVKKTCLRLVARSVQQGRVPEVPAGADGVAREAAARRHASAGGGQPDGSTSGAAEEQRRGARLPLRQAPLLRQGRGDAPRTRAARPRRSPHLPLRQVLQVRRGGEPPRLRRRQGALRTAPPTAGDATAETPAMAAARASRLVSAREGGGGATACREQLSSPAARRRAAALRPSDDEIVKFFREIRKLPPADVGHPAARRRRSAGRRPARAKGGRRRRRGAGRRGSRPRCGESARTATTRGSTCTGRTSARAASAACAAPLPGANINGREALPEYRETEPARRRAAPPSASYGRGQTDALGAASPTCAESALPSDASSTLC